jgi:hypothetical protein
MSGTKPERHSREDALSQEASRCPEPWRAVLKSKWSHRKGEPKGSVHLVRCDGENHDKATAICGTFKQVPIMETMTIGSVGRECEKCLTWAKIGWGAGHTAGKVRQ